MRSRSCDVMGGHGDEWGMRDEGEIRERYPDIKQSNERKKEMEKDGEGTRDTVHYSI